jgi:hypothetical protein
VFLNRSAAIVPDAGEQRAAHASGTLKERPPGHTVGRPV